MAARLTAFAAILALVFAGNASAQEWPPGTVKIIVPFGAGSTPDTVARVLADALKQRHPAATFVVENKAGASGNLGTDAIAKAPSDGSVIGISIGGPLATNTLLIANMPYDPKTDIAPITQLVSQPSLLTVNPSLGIDSVGDLLAAIKRDPSKFNFGSIGTGSLSHLAMQAIAMKAGAKLVHVPYASSPQAITAVIRNDVQVACLPAISVKAHALAGAVKILAVSTAKRSPFFPGVPTLKESGIDVEADAWNGLIAPGGTPKAIIAKINKDVVEIMRQPEIRQRLAAQLMEPVGSTPEEFRKLIDNEVARWAPVIKAANVKLN